LILASPTYIISFGSFITHEEVIILKATAVFDSVEEYIRQFPPDIQSILNEIRTIILSSTPGIEERISYQMPTYYFNGVLVHFACYKKHIGFYPTPSGVQAFKPLLKGYVHAKGSIQFPLNQSIPFELIKSIVEFRIHENQSIHHS
jgi:uncharacterized protein YdhG (YjbR/CyaY superfamily)